MIFSFALFPALVLVAILSSVLMQAMLARLESRHQKTFNSLGKPSIFPNANGWRNLKSLEFVWRRQYMSLDDKALTMLGNGVLVLSCIGVALFTFSIVEFFSNLR